MAHLFSIFSFFLLGNLSLANEDLATLIQKSAELRASFERCDFCANRRQELETFHEEQLLPALERKGKSIQKKPDSQASKLIIDVAILNKKSAAEGFAYSLGDAYLSDPKKFNELVGNLKTNDDIKFIYEKTDWGLQNHINLPKNKMSEVLKDLMRSKAKRSR